MPCGQLREHLQGLGDAPLPSQRVRAKNGLVECVGPGHFTGATAQGT
jgi:hypothetical protein